MTKQGWKGRLRKKFHSEKTADTPDWHMKQKWAFYCPFCVLFLKGFFLNSPYSNNPLSLKYITKWVWSYRGTEEVGEILRYGPALEQGKTIKLKITKCLCTLSSGKCVPYEELCNRLTFRGASSAGFTVLCIYCTTSLCNICKNVTSANIYVYVVIVYS